MNFTSILKSAFNYRLLKTDEEVRFRLFNGLKIASIPVLTCCVLIIFLWVFLSMDLVFFKSNGYANFEQFNEVFYDFIISKLLEFSVIFIGLFTMTLIFGIYISELLLRPFRVIGDYCEKFLEDRSTSYDPDFFSDLKLLTRFSEWFFNTIYIADQNGMLKPIEVPQKFTRIHKPVFEKGFFLQFSFLILATSIVSVIFFYEVIGGVHEQVVQMAFDILPNKYEIQYFLLYQTSVLGSIIVGTLIVQVFAYILLSVNLYKKVSTPAFGIFATMRSFIKGRYDSRVHLIGYSYLRPQCRKLNKYLSEMQKSLHKADKNSIQD